MVSCGRKEGEDQGGCPGNRLGQHLLFSPHPRAAEPWNRLLQDARTDRGEHGSCAVTGGEESIQESRGHDATELQRYLSWAWLLHQQPFGHAIQVVPVFLGQTKVEIPLQIIYPVLRKRRLVQAYCLFVSLLLSALNLLDGVRCGMCLEGLGLL